MLMAGVALGGCGLSRRSVDRTLTRTDRFPAQQRRAYFSFVSHLLASLLH